MKKNPDELRDMVSPRAYCKAEARNFAAGHEQEDWLAAAQGKKNNASISNPWRLWGPYLSERNGARCVKTKVHKVIWDYFSHEQARSRAYRWGEDGIGGTSDLTQRLCFGMARILF
ncbi:DUF2934 domain-containing protein [Methylicorpusculum sp.]|uniref:DUF2934 domain-containing protein n=1 Tax=Methylicorpusculum sp. TaxID=2713644 RepID=UPI002AB9F337|nr:DUF2934 domain-containing protein [Methylicorpusculum sp.]MDZ4152843.1 DUF2934 domain-containing protein [Methylicorpusculum sp.]